MSGTINVVSRSGSPLNDTVCDARIIGSAYLDDIRPAEDGFVDDSSAEGKSAEAKPIWRSRTAIRLARQEAESFPARSKGKETIRPKAGSGSPDSQATKKAVVGDNSLRTEDKNRSRPPPVPVVLKGKGLVDTDTELFPFNYVAGRRSDFQLSAGRDDRMAPAEAKDKLYKIFEMFGVQSEPNEYLYTFTHALLVTHALNGASVVGPGRANFIVNGDKFAYGDVVKFLSTDSRRFYRAYADETAKALLSILDSYDPSDSDKVRICGQIRSIAVNKRLIQYPYLIHDSADACYRTSMAEMAAVTESKRHVLNDGAGGSIKDLDSSIFS